MTSVQQTEIIKAHQTVLKCGVPSGRDTRKKITILSTSFIKQIKNIMKYQLYMMASN